MLRAQTDGGTPRVRRIVDIFALLTVLAVVAAWWMTRGQIRPSSELEDTRLAVDTLRAQILLRSQSEPDILNDAGWPATIDPAWFGDDLPMNTLLSADRPWLEIASETQSGWKHPRPLYSIDRAAAMFWYNPATGTIRARTTLLPTDAETITEYNTVNGTSLTSSDPKTFGDATTLKLTSIQIGEDTEIGE